MQHDILIFSPAGTTKTVAKQIERSLLAVNETVVSHDLTKGLDETVSAINNSFSGGGRHCLWVGSPVYCDHAVPVVEECISKIADGTNGYAVPFVTWGGVTSGLALAELSERLGRKGYATIGAAKILAVHSSMFGSPLPLAHGHPDTGDLELVCKLVEQVVSKLREPLPVTLAAERLDYLSVQLRADAASKSLAAVKSARPGLQADAGRCSQCSLCAELCPVGAIEMEDYPVVDENCILCLQCIRHCPEKAFPVDHEMLAAHIRAMADASDEIKESAIFF